MIPMEHQLLEIEAAESLATVQLPLICKIELLRPVFERGDGDRRSRNPDHVGKVELGPPEVERLRRYRVANEEVGQLAGDALAVADGHLVFTVRSKFELFEYGQRFVIVKVS